MPRPVFSHQSLIWWPAFSRKLLCAALLLFSSNISADTAPSLPPQVAGLLQKNGIPSSALSLVMLPLDSTAQPTVLNADVSLNPASTMKLVTTYAALELLGPTYKWRTEFYADGPLKNGVLDGNLYLKGGGDPKLNMEKLWLLLRDLRSNGVQQIRGDLVLDRSYFIKPELVAFNDDGRDTSKPFLVTPDALLVNLKSLRFIVRSEGGKTQVSSEPPIESIQISNQVQALTNSTGRCAAVPEVHFTPARQATGGLQLTVSGKLAEGCTSQVYMALLDHPTYAAGAVRAIWKELGGQIQGSDRSGIVPQSARLLSRSYSPDMVEIIRDINKYSNNTMARQLFLGIGARFRTAADGNDGMAAQRAIHNWLAAKGIDASQLVMENGSGLSRTERISAREMAWMLKAAWQSPYAAEFIASLPLAGMDGTMRKRLRHTGLAGKAHIKTGTLNNVRAIAGFSQDREGHHWVVVAILNHNQPWGASAILDQILVSLYQR